MNGFCHVPPKRTYLLRQIISAEVEGSLAGFFVDALLAGVAGMLELLELAAAGVSASWLFFLRAMVVEVQLESVNLTMYGLPSSMLPTGTRGRYMHNKYFDR
jgi:hypothetical protein